MPDFDLQTIDLVVIVAIGVWVGRGQTDADGFFLAGRGMTWSLVGFSLIVTNFSGTQFLGLAGAGYDTGIMVWNYEWMATLVLLFFAVLILPIYLQTKISTVPEYMELRYDRRSRYVFSGFTVLTAMLIETAGAMFAGAIVLQLLFPDVPLMVHIIAIAVLGGGYVIVGGLKSVMVTDTIQGIILLIACLVIFVVAFARFEFDWGVFAEMAPENGFTIAPPPSDDFLPWP